MVENAQDAQMRIKWPELCNYVCGNSAKHSDKLFKFPTASVLLVQRSVSVDVTSFAVSLRPIFHLFSSRRLLTVAIDSRKDQEKQRD